MDCSLSNACSSRSHPSKCFENANVECMISEKNALDFLYVNHAEVAWHERRRAWVGDISQRSPRSQSVSIREKIPSWSSTNKELLATIEPFKDPIPLAEMVDSLVDIWLEEGLYGKTKKTNLIPTSTLSWTRVLSTQPQVPEVNAIPLEQVLVIYPSILTCSYLPYFRIYRVYSNKDQELRSTPPTCQKIEKEAGKVKKENNLWVVKNRYIYGLWLLLSGVVVC